MALGVALVACGPTTVGTDSGGDDETTTTAATSASSVGSSASGGEPETGSVDDTGFDPGSTTIDDHDSCGDSCCGFYGGCWDNDFGGPIECDPIGQDCPEGQKCAAWDHVGDGDWSATKCVPLSHDPGQAGDACSVEGSAVSGIDDCDVGLLCFGVDSTTLEGKCIELCDQPGCTVEGTTCMGLPGNIVGGCLVSCDPLAPECEELEGCYPFADDEAGCAPDGSGEGGEQGDTCVWVTDCAPGLTCVTPEELPDCEADFWGGCCTVLCDPSGDGSCGEDLPELLCTPFSGDPLVGACTLP
jgi:hypothetical protein